MSRIDSFRDLLVWQKSLDPAMRCYKLVRRFPRHDQNVLGSEIRKSALSMPSNIAEGKNRHHTAIYVIHLWIANGSGAELQTQLEVAKQVAGHRPGGGRVYQGRGGDWKNARRAGECS